MHHSQSASLPLTLTGVVSPAGPVLEGDTVKITCQKGFKLDPNTPSQATCKATWKGGQYDRTGSACITACGAYPAVAHGSSNGPTDPLAGDKVYIVCDDGHDLTFDSSSVATCQDDGTFDYPTAQCVPTCPAYPPISHGTLSMPGPTQLGDVVVITCDPGWELLDPGASSVECVAYDNKGVWTGEYNPSPGGVQCVQFCAPFDAGEHGITSPAGRIRAGETIDISCETGFVLRSPTTAKCKGGSRGAVFDRTSATCIATCSPLAKGAHSRLHYDHMFPGKMVLASDTYTVKCDYGHQIAPGLLNKVTCMPDGQYDQALPECRAICASFRAPEHGAVSPQGAVLPLKPQGAVFAGDTMEITCDAAGGWELADPQNTSVQCIGYNAKGQYTGEYSPSPKGVACVQKCAPFPDVLHGQVSPTGAVAVGDSVAIMCDKGFALPPKSTGTARCAATGKGAAFSPAEAQCVVTCPPFPVPAHGTVSGPAQPLSGDVVTVRCDAGHMPGATEVMCRADGTYNRAAVECAAFCPAHPVLPYGTVTPREKTPVGGVVYLACNKGYALTDSKSADATCVAYNAKGQYTGEYAPAAAECVQVCDPFAAPAHATVSPAEAVPAGASVTVTCEDGYVVSGGKGPTAIATCTSGIFSAGFSPKVRAAPRRAAPRLAPRRAAPRRTAPCRRSSFARAIPELYAPRV